MQSVAFGAHSGTLVDGAATGQPQIWKLPSFPALSQTPQHEIQRILRELQ
jgi:hypothetical protein